jgi:prepilin-type N-terminal cleavage/methylation domain-containing protein
MNFNFDQSAQSSGRRFSAAFTLMEVVISLAILGMVISGLIFGYVQANWTAEWCSMSTAAQSYASQGAEQARSANWRPRDYPPTDNLTNGIYRTRDYMDIPTKGTPSDTDFPFWVTNIVTITDISANPPVRQIRSDAVWTYPMNGRLCTNTVILIRASDQ